MGGAEQVVRQTISGLRNLGSIYLITNNEIISYYDDLLPSNKICNIGDIYLHTKRKYRWIRYLLNNRFYSLIPNIIRLKTRGIADFLINNNIEVVHSHLDYALFSSLLIKRIYSNLKVIHTVHCEFGFTKDRLLKPWIPLSSIDFSRIDKLIFVSDYNYRLYESGGIPIRDFKVIHNGIDLSNMVTYSRPLKTGDKYSILFVGGSKYVKGYDILLETVNLLNKSNFKLNYKVVVLGHISDDCNLKLLIRKYELENYFKLVGFVPPPHHLEYFKASDILFMPSRSEAFPIAAIEAVCLDLPVIASNIGGLPEIITHGENGLLGSNNPSVHSVFIKDILLNYNSFLDRTIKFNLNKKPYFEAKRMCQDLLTIYEC